MTVFNFSTGNAANLTAGGAALMSDIQGSLNDLKSFLNGGSMDETNVPNLSAAFTTWKTIAWGGGAATSAVVTVGGTYVVWGPSPTQAGTQNVQTLGTSGSAGAAFYLDPADYAANARSTKYRLRAQCITNSVAPATNLVPGLYPIGGFGGGSGVNPTIASFGTVVAGSTVTFTTPGASSVTTTLSTEFAAPAANTYLFGVLSGGAVAANSASLLLIQLQMRQV